MTVCCVPDMAKHYKVTDEGFIKFFLRGKVVIETVNQVNQSLVCRGIKVLTAENARLRAHNGGRGPKPLIKLRHGRSFV